LSTRDPHIIGVERTHYLPGIRRAVVVTTIEEELVHQVIDVMFPHWDSRPGLSPMRPCRPSNAKPVDDELLSNIGRSLLALAARRDHRIPPAASMAARRSTRTCYVSYGAAFRSVYDDSEIRRPP
jgi:hypothetical protein